MFEHPIPLTKFNQEVSDENARISKAEQHGDKLDLEIARKHKELFLLQHDVTGALKRDRLSRDLAEEIETRTGKPLNERLPEDDQNGYLLVSLGQLDRANDEEGHKGGDTALNYAAGHIEEVIRKHLYAFTGQHNMSGEDQNKLIRDSYEIYRFSGSDFFVKLKSPPGLETFISETASDLNGAEISAGGKSRLPMSCVNLTQGQMLDIYQKTQEDGVVEIEPTSRNLMEIAIDTLDIKNRVETLKQTQNMFKHQFGDGDISELKRLKAEDHFNLYLKKLFEGKVGSGKELLEMDSTGVEFLGYSIVTEKFSTETPEKADIATRRDIAIKKVVLEHTVPKELLAIPGTHVEFPDDAEMNRERVDPKIYNEYIPPTKGRRVLQEVASELQMLVETGADPRLIESGKLDIEIAAARMDSLTGLKDRKNFYNDLEVALENGKHPNVVFIDMGFLKFLNQNGGRELGNYALKESGRIFEQAIEETGLDAKAYRYAGDEFTILSEEVPEKLQALIQRINQLRDKLGPIKPTFASDKNYRPMSLAFNYGISDIQTTRKLYGDLSAQNLINEEEGEGREKHFNFLAETQTILADLSVEEQKAYERMHTMMGLIEQRGSDDPWLTYFHRFSTKAIFNMSIPELTEFKARMDSVDSHDRDSYLMRFVHEKMVEKFSNAEGEMVQEDLVIKRAVYAKLLGDQMHKIQREYEKTEHGAEKANYLKIQLDWYQSTLEKFT